MSFSSKQSLSIKRDNLASEEIGEREGKENKE
jgi:hypothetical protein